jgi:predicted metal-binding membrane protein
VSISGLALPAVERLRRPRVHPEYVVLGGVAAAAWVLLAASGHLSPGHGGHGKPSMHMAHGMSMDGHGSALGVVGLIAMTVAMMAPGLAPMTRYVRERALRRRWWAAPTVVVSYFAVWLALGIMVSRVAPSGGVPAAVVASLLVVAAVWQLTPAKRWAVRACDRPVGLQLRGARATRSELLFGLHQGTACVGSCWALMVPMMLGAGPMLLLMATGTAVVTAERVARRPNLARRVGAALLVVAAIAVAW